MKYVKMLGLLAVAAAALMAFAGSASADEATSPTGTQYTGTIVATSTNPVLATSVGKVTCTHSVIEGTITDQGVGKDLKGDVKHLTFSGCNHTVTPIANGGKYGTQTIDVTATNEGTMTSDATEVTVLFHSTFLGTIHCIYKTSNTILGPITGGEPAKLHATAVEIPRVSTDFGCGSESSWSGDYEVTTPKELHLDAN